MHKTFLKIGHRGAKGHIAENTLESIQNALDFGVNGIEIDVHRCATGELVVFHDFTLDRMTNGSGEISNYTLSELKQLKITGTYKIPTLVEVLNLIDRKCLLNIELKGKNTAKEACRLINLYVAEKGWKYSDFIVSSFQHHELKTVFEINKKIPTGVLTKASVADAIEFAQKVKGIAIHPNVALLTSNNVKVAQEKGFVVIAWTANDIETINRIKKYGVDGIISDYPDRL